MEKDKEIIEPKEEFIYNSHGSHAYVKPDANSADQDLEPEIIKNAWLFLICSIIYTYDMRVV